MTVPACLGGYSGISSKSAEQIVVGSRVSPGTKPKAEAKPKAKAKKEDDKGADKKKKK